MAVEICKIWPSVRLLGVRNEFLPQDYFLRNFVFSNSIQMAEDFVRWELVFKDMKMAPHVCPCDEAPIMSEGSHGSVMASPSYVKAKTVVDPCKPPRGISLSAPWMSLTGEERLAMKMISDTRMLENAVQLREEFMAAKALQTGQYTVTEWDEVTGKHVEKSTVNFKRSKHLSQGCGEWGDKKSCVALDDLEDWGQDVSCESGAEITDVIFGHMAWKAFRRSGAVREALKCGAAVPGTFNIDLDLNPQMKIGGYAFKGQVNNVNIWVSTAFYHCNGKKVFFIDPDACIGLSMNAADEYSMGATRLYGAIKVVDEMEPVERHLQSWTTIDPSKRYEKIESAPMPILTNANGTFYKTIKNVGDAIDESDLGDAK